MRLSILGGAAAALLLLAGCQSQPAANNATEVQVAASALAPLDTVFSPSFRQSIDGTMPHLGAGNWILIVDSSFPKSSRSGFKTVPVNVRPVGALKEVLDAIKTFGHVSPRIYVDKELGAVSESDAPGIGAYREAVQKAVGSLPLETSQSAADLMKVVRQASTEYRVLVIKTPSKLPYSSIYIELGPGNWNQEKESRLRAALGK